ncbi:hypothetical protein ACFUJU_04560 [Streptomyces sp. NPDC057235]|uniref:hypothetical protein n=1 Tax=Streptomyces sp. NPDC057235 TaxID=3346058 RepID=UPI003629B4A4
MFTSTKSGAAAVAVALALLCVSCGASGTNGTGTDGTGTDGGTPTGTTASASATPPAGREAGDAPTATGGDDAPAGGDAAPSPGATSVELVRDAFAGLQATLYDSCGASGDCPYFLGRVHDELQRMDRAMKGDAKGPGHFPEPIALIGKLNGALDGDRSPENLKKHRSLLIGTRDRINTWMQGHPDDYR